MSAVMETLRYQGEPGDTMPMRGHLKMSLDISGPGALVNQLRSSNAMLSIEQIDVRGEGNRIVTACGPEGMTITVGLGTVRVAGFANRKPFAFDFVVSAGAPDEYADRLAAVSWGFGVANRAHLLSALGDYSLPASEDDANSEALTWMLTAPARLPDPAVAVGEPWTSKWTGRRRAKKTGGVYLYEQVAKLREVAGGNSRRAHITFDTTAKMDIPAGSNPQNEVTKLKSTGSTVLDLETGRVVSNHSTGSIVTALVSLGLTLEFRLEGKYEQA